MGEHGNLKLGDLNVSKVVKQGVDATTVRLCVSTRCLAPVQS
jgi:hypothetical protein